MFKNKKMKKIKYTFFIMIFICILLYGRIYALDFFKRVEENKNEEENISIIKKGNIFSPQNDINFITQTNNIYEVKSNEIGSENKFNTYIPFLKNEQNGGLVFSCEENLRNPNKDEIYKKAESNVPDNIDYDAAADIRYVENIHSKDLKNLNNISRETKNSITYLSSKIYLNLEGENRKKLKKDIFKKAIGDTYLEAYNKVSDLDMYMVFQICIWDIIDKKERNFDDLKIVNVNENGNITETVEISDSNRKKYINKIYKYLLEESINNKEFENPYKRVSLKYKGEKEKTNDGMVLKNIKIEASSILIKNISDLEIKIFSGIKNEYILVPKDKMFFIEENLKTEKNNEYIKRKIEENTYKETNFNILIDNKFLEENFGKDYDLSRIKLNLRYTYDENISYVYIPSNDEYKSILNILKNTNKYNANVNLTYKQKDVRAHIGIEKINNINISGRKLESKDIDPSNLLNLVNPFGKETSFKTINEKDRLEVLPEDNIVFNINIYNEGDVDSILGDSLVYIPDGLNIDLEDELNILYKWEKISNNIYKSGYLKNKTVLGTSKTSSDKNANIMKIDDANLKIKCKVKNEVNNLDVMDIYFKLANAAFLEEQNNNINLENIVENLGDKNSKEIDFFENKDRDSIFVKDDEYIKYFNEMVNLNDDTLTKEEIIVNEKGDLSLETNIDGKKDNLDFKEGEILKLNLDIINEGKVEMSCGKLSVKIPEYLEFEKDSNTNLNESWFLEDGFVSTEKMANTKIKEGAKYSTSLELRVKKVSKEIKEEKISFKIVSEIKKQDRGDIDSSPNTLDFREKINDEDLKNIEDDTDFVNVNILKETRDLSLRIRGIKKGNSEIENRKDYIKNIEINDDGKIKYNLPKDNIKVNKNERIVFEISIFNEGKEKTNGEKISVLLPPYLEFLDNNKSKINEKYVWNIRSKRGKIIETNILKEKEINGREEKGIPNREILELELIVNGDILENEKQIIVAQIEKSNKGDKDSISGSLNFEYGENDPDGFQKEYLFNLQNEDLTQNKYFVAKEDDDDFESVVLKKDSLDLSLKMYIDKINGEKIEGSEPLVNIKDVINGRSDAYKISKNPKYVKKGDELDFNIRVYNEGEKEAVASEIKIYVPENMAYIMEDKTNIENLWKIENAKDPEKLSKYLKIEGEDKLILKGPIVLKRNEIKSIGEKPYNMIPAITDKDIFFIDYKIKMISLAEDEENAVKNIKFNSSLISENSEEENLKENKKIKEQKEENKDHKENKEKKYKEMVVFAEISEIFEPNGLLDIDSIPNNFRLDTFSYYTKEDDTDFVVLSSKKVKMDLSLKMGVSKILGEETNRSETYSRIEELSKDKTNLILDKKAVKISPKDKVELKIRVYNEGDISAFAKKIAIYLPENLVLEKEDKINIEGKYKTLNKDRVYTNDENETRILETNVLSYENLKSIGKAIPIYPLDKKTGEISFHEIKLVLKVKEGIKNESFKLYAKIEEATDIYGNYVNDTDSSFKPLDIFKENNSEEISLIEDSLDYEIFETIYFDLILKNDLESIGILKRTNNGLKYIKKDINKKDKEKLKEEQNKTKKKKEKQNKKQKIININLLKKDIKKAVNLEFLYSINVENIGKVEGYASEIEVKLPEGFNISPKNRANWRNKNKDEIISNDLSNNIIMPGDKKTINLLLEVDPAFLSYGNVKLESNISKVHNDLALPNLEKNQENNGIAKIKILDIENVPFYIMLFGLLVLDYIYIYKLLTPKNILNILITKKNERKIV